MMHVTNPLEKDVTDLFESGKLHVNDMREFFAESVCEMLDDGMTPMKHYEAALHIFDRWYRDLRKTIWTNGSRYALTHTTHHPEEAKKTAATMYWNAYRNIDRKHRKELRNED
nr:MAG: hypothetical protein [Bacteriophage sp.]